MADRSGVVAAKSGLGIVIKDIQAAKCTAPAVIRARFRIFDMAPKLEGGEFLDKGERRKLRPPDCKRFPRKQTKRTKIFSPLGWLRYLWFNRKMEFGFHSFTISAGLGSHTEFATSTRRSSIRKEDYALHATAPGAGKSVWCNSSCRCRCNSSRPRRLFSPPVWSS